MPKGYIESSLRFGGPDNLDPRPFRVRVGWSREVGDVQIATVDENDGHDGSGFFVDLDRRGINDLIRVLRRARDQAFGRDE